MNLREYYVALHKSKAMAKQEPAKEADNSTSVQNEFKLDIIFVLFSALSIVLALLPQSGYIHPDEFFQSVEVVAGDIFGYDVTRPWEFDPRFPIRSIVLPSIITGPPFALLQALSRTRLLGGIIEVTPYTLTVVPRLTFAILSIMCNFYLGKLADSLGFTAKFVRCAYATSYVALVFYSRTFSNTIESFLFVMLLYLVRRYLYAKGTSGAYLITLVIVAGVFNRPTFAFYAFIPFLYWFLSMDIRPSPSRRHRVSVLQMTAKLIVCSFYGWTISCFFIACDTVYFKRKTLEQLVDAFIRSKSAYSYLQTDFAITPLNFVIYNMDPANLKEHGLHPRITHLIVNIPLLFGPMAFYLFIELYYYVRRFMSGTVLPARQFLLFSIYMPISMLSVFPHQEPRFLIPLLAPLCALYGYKLFSQKCSDFVSCTWITFTALGVLFFGFVHQGGVVPSIAHLSNEFTNRSQSVPLRDVQPINHVIFSHTYMPPKHIFQLSSDVLTDVHDLKGSSVETLSLTIRNLQADRCPAGRACYMYIVIPKSLRHYVERVTKDTGIPLVLHESFFPHLSTEDPPQFKTILAGSRRTCVQVDESGRENFYYPCLVRTFFNNVLSFLEIEIYQVVLNTGRGVKLKGSFKS